MAERADVRTDGGALTAGPARALARRAHLQGALMENEDNWILSSRTFLSLYARLALHIIYKELAGVEDVPRLCQFEKEAGRAVVQGRGAKAGLPRRGHPPEVAWQSSIPLCRMAFRARGEGAHGCALWITS
mmetsp:Transcript_31435/g.121636  ORF Transcript_31435/g.121636 Transcript_31435/m.121636 type:complete len:131 (-) Transcript_31435:167-559(-)